MTATKKQLAKWAGLKNRKDRDETGLFLAEGRKLVDELLAARWRVEAILVADTSLDAEDELSYGLTPEQMQRVSGFRTAPEVLAVVQKPLSFEQPRWVDGTLALVLDGLQDPGNVGTVIRTAAWFGVESVFYTASTADPFGPKAVQASMGALFRVKTGLVDASWFDQLPATTPVIGTFLSGDSLFEAGMSNAGLLLLGNEGHGISPEMEARITRRVTIPRFGSGAESLNVAAAAAVVLAEFRRGGRVYAT